MQEKFNLCFHSINFHESTFSLILWRSSVHNICIYPDWSENVEGTEKFIYALNFSMTVTDLILSKLKISQQLFMNNYCVRLHENLTYSIVAGMGWNTDEWVDTFLQRILSSSQKMPVKVAYFKIGVLAKILKCRDSLSMCIHPAMFVMKYKHRILF
jgi:hypothetical protein